MRINQFWVRIMGLSGIIGGLILFAGDMLLYYDQTNPSLNQNMGNASDFRIKASAVTALFATWFYLIGVGQIYYAFKPTRTILKNIIVACFSSILIAFGIVHGAFIAIATSAKLATEHNIDMQSATLLAIETNNIMRLFVYPIFAILSLVFITQVWKRKSLYPRWIILFFPLIPFLLQDLICKYLPNNVWIVIYGGYLNLILITFFTASTIALWKVGKR